MLNTTKYFVLLENLKFANEGVAENAEKQQPQDAARQAHNLTILQKYVKNDVQEQLNELCTASELTKDLKQGIKINTEHDSYIVRLQHALFVLTSNINFDSNAKEDLISVAHLKLCIQSTQELSYCALRRQLHKDFYKSPVFKQVQPVAEPNLPLLSLTVSFFTKLLVIQQLHIANSMDLVLRDVLAAVTSLKVEKTYTAQLNSMLAHLWQHESQPDFFRNILLLKATPKLSENLAKELHDQLLDKLTAAHGFASLVTTLQAGPNVNRARTAEVVANIVARHGYKENIQLQMIQQIFEFCRFALLNVDIIGAGVLSLRRLYELSTNNRNTIQEILASHWQHLTEPEDLLSGLIIMEHEELCNQISLWQQLFCSSSVACLPSELLVQYLPLFLQLHHSFPETMTARRQLAALIIRCLDNRTPNEKLSSIIYHLFKWELPSDWQKLNQRVCIVPVAEFTKVNIKVAPSDFQLECNISSTLLDLLMSSSHHALTYKIFMVLMRIMLQQLEEQSVAASAIELLSTEAELAAFLHSKYDFKLQLLMALNTLVSYQPLKSQLAENTKDFMHFVRDLLQQRLTAGANTMETSDQMLLLILTLFQELLERHENMLESTREIRSLLQQLATLTQNRLVQQRLQQLLSLLSGDWKASAAHNAHPFKKARELIEEKESHLQVYGIQMMLQLLRDNDTTTVSQGHLIIALALTTLKDKESYTFLNCVRLFVALVRVMEAEVLEKLSDEYLSDTAELDYRLVVGETILKTSQELGPLCYKYKAVMLNCFMHGARSSLDEFRMSAFSNLSHLCRILSYQVQSFFQELLQLIDIELSSGSYLPAKRAAVLVLADLLEGMDNLMDFEEMLLPIYRLLKVIEGTESCDKIMRQQAANGLKALNEKVYQMLRPAENLHKEIKVLGIKDRPQRSKHILEID